MTTVFKPGDLLVYAGSLWTACPNERDGKAVIYLGESLEQNCVHCGVSAESSHVGSPCPDQMPHRFDYKERYLIAHPVKGIIALDSLAFNSWRLLARI